MRTRNGTYDTPKRTPAARALEAADVSSGRDTESPISPSLDIDTSIGVKVAPSSMLLPMFVASIVVMKVVCAAAAIARIDEERDARRRVIVDEMVDSTIASMFGNTRKRSADGTTRKYIKWDRERALSSIKDDYLGPNPRFDDRQFERIFRITRSLADFILRRLASADEFWRTSYDCFDRMANSPEAKFLISLKMVCYGKSASAFQDYFQMGDSTARKCLYKLSRAIVSDPEINSTYLRKMTKADAVRVEAMHRKQHGIAGMVGSLDVTHIPWKNCPMELKGQHEGKEGVATLGLEASADYNLWIWHYAFGFPGALNDINIWERSSLHQSFIDGSPINLLLILLHQLRHVGSHVTNHVLDNTDELIGSTSINIVFNCGPNFSGGIVDCLLPLGHVSAAALDSALDGRGRSSAGMHYLTICTLVRGGAGLEVIGVLGLVTKPLVRRQIFLGVLLGRESFSENCQDAIPIQLILVLLLLAGFLRILGGEASKVVDISLEVTEGRLEGVRRAGN